MAPDTAPVLAALLGSFAAWVFALSAVASFYVLRDAFQIVRGLWRHD